MRDVGFCDAAALGTTDFWTSNHTRGVDFRARKKQPKLFFAYAAAAAASLAALLVLVNRRRRT